MSLTRESCLALDAADPLRGFRDRFHLPPGVIYLDGNSLGPLPRDTPARVARLVEQEWGQGLIRSWNTAGWIDAPARLGDLFARLIGPTPAGAEVAGATNADRFWLVAASMVQAPGGGCSRPVE